MQVMPSGEEGIYDGGLFNLAYSARASLMLAAMLELVVGCYIGVQ
jgi:hypothetical protein